MSKGQCDTGYGVTGNNVMFLYLSNLDDSKRRDVEMELEKEDKVKYDEYKEWEKLYLKY